MVIIKRLFWVGATVATWQFLGCSKISEQFEPSATAIGSVAYQSIHRKVYQHSVIPGGIYTGEELARARRTDPVVGEHYADFGADARVSRLSGDELVYISYRKANKVFWSKKKHRVCEGEAVITDGKNLARARCGNRLSKTPKLPTADKEPTESALNTPEVPPLAIVDTGAGPYVDAANLPVPGFDPGIPAANAGVPNDKTVPAVVPVDTAASTGASKAFGEPIGFLPSVSSYFSAGPLAAPGLVTTNSGTTTPTTPASPTSGTTPTTPTTPITITQIPEPNSIVLVLVGVWLCSLARRRFA